MGLFDMISKAKGSTEPTYTPLPPVPDEIPHPLFGNRTRADEVAPELKQEANGNSSIKDLASQIAKMIGVGGNEKDAPEDNTNYKGLFSEIYLQNVAALRLSQLKIKYNLKVSLIKMAFGKMLEAVGKDVQAKKVWDTQVTLGNMDEVIQEIIYLDLSHQNKMGTLKPISPDEFISGLTTMAFEKVGGEGFENYVELVTGIFDKVKSMMQPKQAPPSNG